MPIRRELRHLYTRPEWIALSLRIRTVRAGGRCECGGECGTDHVAENFAAPGVVIDQPARCSALDGQPHPITKRRVKLTVAHLDHNPPNDDETRLKALCQRCHNRYDAEHRKGNAHKTRRGRKAIGDLLGDGTQ